MTTHKLYGCLIAVSLVACGGSSPAEKQPAKAESKEAPAKAPPEPEEKQADPAANPLAVAMDAYLEVVTALAGDDAAGGKAAFARLETALGEDALKDSAAKGAGTDDISAQREVLHEVSMKLIERVKADGNPSAADVHLAFCPMAFDNKGAHWLQGSKDIANPYFGAKMLTCGEVKASAAGGEKLADAGAAADHAGH